MKSARTIDPQIPQHLVPITPDADLGILDSRRKRPPVALALESMRFVWSSVRVACVTGFGRRSGRGAVGW